MAKDGMTGLVVKEVNIGITDLYFPDNDDTEKKKNAASNRNESFLTGFL